MNSFVRRVAVLLALALLACNRTPSEVADDCLAVPPAAQVEIVKVAVLNPDGTTRRTYQIDTRPHIEVLPAAVGPLQEGGCKTFHGRRPQELTVSFQGYDSVPLILWIGPDWIGGVDTKKDARGWLLPRWRSLHQAEHTMLLDLLHEETPPGG
jgi:hypothetical protein